MKSKTLVLALIASGAFMLGWAYGLLQPPVVIMRPVVVSAPCSAPPESL